MKNKNKVNIPLLLAGILFCLTLISSSLTSNLIAKYSTTALGSDSARVAKFNVSATENNQSANIALAAGDSSSTGEYKFTITNNSEVVVKYSIIVKNVPNQVKVIYNGTQLISTGSGDLTFDAGELDIGASVDCTLIFSALDGSTTQTTQVTIQVLTEQVD